MKKYVILIFLVAIMSLGLVSYSQDEYLEEEMETENIGDVDYAYGSVVKLDKNLKEITVSEYDWDTDSDIDVAYSIVSGTKVEGVDSWQDIKTGDYVDIEYMHENGKRIIRYISIYFEEDFE